MKKNTPALRKMKNENGAIVLWSEELYSLLNVRKKPIQWHQLITTGITMFPFTALVSCAIQALLRDFPKTFLLFAGKLNPQPRQRSGDHSSA
jgi:hypothetical protein